MADFEIAVAKLLVNEGGYSFDPDDPGGETNFGISKNAYPKLDIKNLTEDQAKAIYRRDYWKFDEVLSQPVADKLLDMAVQFGEHDAIEMLQVSLGWNSQATNIDGVFGPVTQASLNQANEQDVLRELRARSAVRYAGDAIGGEEKYLLGWMRRALQ